MAEIVPFRGIFYNLDRIGDAEKVVTPPYDVISAEEQEMYYGRSDYNIIRLILGKEFEGDNEVNNRYTRAAAFYNGWRDEGILVEDSSPALYVYEQDYIINTGIGPSTGMSRDVDGDAGAGGGPRKKVTGVIGAVKLEEFDKGVILPHEDTLPGPKQDRLELMRATGANFSPIFALYSDAERRVDRLIQQITQTLPRIDMIDGAGTRHRLWSISNPGLIYLIVKEFRRKQLFIADGHHRYETALVYRNEMRRRANSEKDLASVEAGWGAPYEYIMMLLVNMDTEGLTVLPTHRLIGDAPELHEYIDSAGGSPESGARAGAGPGAIAEKLAGLVGPVFNLRTFDDLEGALDEMSRARAFICYFGHKQYCLLTMRDDEVTSRRVGDIFDAAGVTQRLRRELDVAILHVVLLGHFFSISDESFKQRGAYTRDAAEAIRLVDEGKFKAAFLVNPTRLDQIAAIASAGEKMPQKSTYFYPKPLTGLVIRSLIR
ncbi:MAG: DUF1015 domain-containing protein [Firmicutes bacterium]|nr:DUF1015 domain-containing protein [Bacillota bacterium]